MKYGLYSTLEGRFTIAYYAGNRGWNNEFGLEDAIYQLESGKGWRLHFDPDPDLAIHLVDFDTLPQLYSDYPELFI